MVRDDQRLTDEELSLVAFRIWSKVEQDFGPMSLVKIPVSDDPEPGVDDGGDDATARLLGWLVVLVPALIVAGALVFIR